MQDPGPTIAFAHVLGIVFFVGWLWHKAEEWNRAYEKECEERTHEAKRVAKAADMVLNWDDSPENARRAVEANVRLWRLIFDRGRE